MKQIVHKGFPEVLPEPVRIGLETAVEKHAAADAFLPVFY